MVNLGIQSPKDELINEMADMLQNILYHEFGFSTNAVNENDVHQLIKKARGKALESKTENHIKDLFNVSSS